MKKAICLVVMIAVAFLVASCGERSYGERYEAFTILPLPVYNYVYDDVGDEIFGYPVLTNTWERKLDCYVWGTYYRTDYANGSTAAQGTCIGNLE